MRLVLDSDPSILLVRRYGDGVIVVNEQSLSTPFLLSPQRLVPEWNARSIGELTAEQLEPLLALKPEIALLGAGDSPSWPSAELRRLCRARRIALECMVLGAACRTYNVLAGEQRQVVAGLFP